jgi:hypothetical protein
MATYLGTDDGNTGYGVRGGSVSNIGEDISAKETQIRKRLSIPIVLLCVGLGGCACFRAKSSLPVPLLAQQTSLWCWAASGQMVMNYLGGSVDQGDEANKEFSRGDCSNAPTPGACVQGGWPEPDKYGFTFDRTSDSALTWDQVKRQVCCGKKPFAFSWHWTGGGGHMMVAIGYSTQGTDTYVKVNDPWPPNVGDRYKQTYSDYVSGSDHTHWDDFYNVTKKK